MKRSCQFAARDLVVIEAAHASAPPKSDTCLLADSVPKHPCPPGAGGSSWPGTIMVGMRATPVALPRAAVRVGTPSTSHLAADTPRAEQPWL
jgi:hypothetical protein